MRIGELLVRQGMLTQGQVDRALAEQRHTGEPFGVVCERLFGVAPKVIEGAWATQYAQIVANIEPKLDATDPAAEATVTRRQAWQFKVAPLRYDEGQLIVATSVEFLPRALRFALTHLAAEVFFVLVPPRDLARHLTERFPMLGMDEELLRRGFAA
ncbi:MAG: hypothetical protein JNM94_08765 [Phycisphaerae bacterium]|nr:hypothetical protein [Phycisphaerae bacterium]